VMMGEWISVGSSSPNSHTHYFESFEVSLSLHQKGQKTTYSPISLATTYRLCS
jgi:hypothetical protein